MDKRFMDSNDSHVNGGPPGREVSSPFVGRDDELRRLTLALNRITEGQGGSILLTGRPGMGKTRLASIFLALARERGFMVLEGRAFPVLRGLACRPFVDAFRPLLHSYNPARLETLIRDLPDLARLFGGLDLPVPQPLGDPAIEKTRLFETVLRLFERLSREAPVVLFIDDLHWADPVSLELLQYLARGLIDQRTLLLGTSSTGALDDSPGSGELAMSLMLEGLAEEISIQRLEPAAVDKLVQGILGREAPAGLIDLLEARASGVPFVIQATVFALIETGLLMRTNDGWKIDSDGAMALPASLRQLILDRLVRIPPGDRRLLDLIAIMGDAISYTILRAASGLVEENLRERLRRLRASGLVSERMHEAEVTCSISHSLVQEVIYAGVPEAERRHAHLAAIEALESCMEGQPEVVNRLAHHYHGAGPQVDASKALAVFVAAGEQARAVFASEQATLHYTAALAIVRDGCCYERLEIENRGLGSLISKQDEPILPWLLERLGEALERTGKGEAAVAAWSEALAERERTGQALAACRLRRHLALAEWNGGHFEKANVHLREGLAILQRRTDNEPCQEQADLHSARFVILSHLGDTDGLERTAAELLQLARQSGSPRAEAEANSMVAYFKFCRNDVPSARELALHALKLGEQTQDLALSCRAHRTLGHIYMRMGDHRSKRFHAEQGLSIARRLGAPDQEILFLLGLSRASLLSGAWSESLRWSAEAAGLARRVGYPRDLAYALAHRAMIVALQGDLSEAEVCISRVRTTFGGDTTADRAVFVPIEIAETAVALERMQARRALMIAEGFVFLSTSALEVESPASTPPTHVPAALTLLAEAQVSAGEAEKALETAARITNLGPVGLPYLTALASRVEGLARQAMGQTAAAIHCLARAYEAFIALEIPFEAARSLFEQATILAANGWSSPAIMACQQSLSIFEHVDAQRYVYRVQQLLRELGFSAPSARRTRAKKELLSLRELEVARLVADGLTSARIAERLCLSRYTVNTHLEHIYARLGIGSRAALTRHLIETGLLSSNSETR